MMIKKAAILLGAAGILCSTASMATTITTANGRGFYLGLQFSYGKPSVSGSGASGISVAVPNKQPEFNPQSNLELNASGTQVGAYGIRISTGYNFDQYVGLEFGFRTNDGFQVKYHADQTRPGPIFHPETYHDVADGESGRVNVYTGELLAKLATPALFNRLSFFIKGGIADVFLANSKATYSGTTTWSGDLENPLPFKGKFKTAYSGQHIHPEGVVGILVNLGEGAGLQASYAYIPGSGTVADKNFSPKLGVASVGLIFRFA